MSNFRRTFSKQFPSLSFRLSLVLISLFVTSCEMISFLEGVGSQDNTSLRAGKTAPDFILETTSGEEFALGELRGHPVILNFWASWCGPCRSEMPDIQYIHETYASEGLIVVGINNEESASEVAEFGNAYGLTFPLLLDIDGEIAAKYLITALPTTFFIAEDGTIKKIQIGSMNQDEIENILAESLLFPAQGDEISEATPEDDLADTDANLIEIEGCVTVSSLRVRSGPGTNYSLVGGLTGGECRLFDGRNAPGSWLRLAPDNTTKDGTSCWVSAEFIDLEGNIENLQVVEE